MKILVANDDGIEAEGLRYLAEFASSLGEVTVAAPKYQQSAKSHCVIIDRPFEVVELDTFDYIGARAYRIDATPADCVRFSLDYFPDRFDFVFAGINSGLNIGNDISYSGTCGICFEAGLSGVRSVAFSAKSKHIKQAAEYLRPVWDYLLSKNAFSHCGIFNVNIPPEPKGILLTTQGREYYKDKFLPAEEPNMYYAEYTLARSPETVINPSVDIDAVLLGYCSVTPLSTRRTDYKAYEEMTFN